MNAPARDNRRGGATRFALVITACLAALLVVGGLTVRYVVVEVPTLAAERMSRGAIATAEEVAAKIAAAFQVRPRTVVENRTLLAQEAEVLQLVTYEQARTERYRLDESWLHSTKTLEVEADVVVRAGFDFEKPFVVSVEEAGAVLRVQLPPAQILSTEIRDVRFTRDESGLWNRLTPEDRERALRELRLRAAAEARASDLAARARANAEKRLRELLAGQGRTVTFEAPEAGSAKP